MTTMAADLEQFRLPALSVRRSSRTAWGTEYDVLDGEDVLGRIYRVTDHPASPWFWAIPARLAGRKAFGTADSLDEVTAAFKAEYERLGQLGQERLRADTDEIRRRRGTREKAEISPSIAIPAIKAAVDEHREAVRDLWARLLAAAMDPDRKNLVRLAFVEVIKKMDPLDVEVLELGQREFSGSISGGTLDELAKRLDVSRDEIDASLSNLVKLDLTARSYTSGADAVITPLGRELLRAVSD
jgi:hypothetical protein